MAQLKVMSKDIDTGKYKLCGHFLATKTNPCQYSQQINLNKKELGKTRMGDLLF